VGVAAIAATAFEVRRRRRKRKADAEAFNAEALQTIKLGEETDARPEAPAPANLKMAEERSGEAADPDPNPINSDVAPLNRSPSGGLVFQVGGSRK
jgi:hypothetical protein